MANSTNMSSLPETNINNHGEQHTHIGTEDSHGDADMSDNVLLDNRTSMNEPSVNVEISVNETDVPCRVTRHRVYPEGYYKDLHEGKKMRE